MKTYSNPQTSIHEFDMCDSLMQGYGTSPVITDPSISGSETGSNINA